MPKRTMAPPFIKTDGSPRRRRAEGEEREEVEEKKMEEEEKGGHGSTEAGCRDSYAYRVQSIIGCCFVTDLVVRFEYVYMMLWGRG